MAKKTDLRGGPTREQLTDYQFACVCGAYDILYKVWLRVEMKKKMEAINGPCTSAS